MEIIKRIHHISAIVGKAQENLNFYRDILGLKLVKKTINFDDPGVYHLYFANHAMDNGTIMTFFPWENHNKGRKGSGQVGRIAFSIPKGTINYWKTKLTDHNIHYSESQLFANTTLEFQDVHSLDLALVESNQNSSSQNILGFYGVVLNSNKPLETIKLLSEHLGLTKVTEDDKYVVLETIGKEHHRVIIPKVSTYPGRFGIGTVHHIAWSVPTKEKLIEWQDYFMNHNYGVTEVKDRKYFKSIYMPESGNIIFEFATDGPGFDVDESRESVGKKLMLPEEYETSRKELEKILPKLD